MKRAVVILFLTVLFSGFLRCKNQDSIVLKVSGTYDELDSEKPNDNAKLNKLISPYKESLDSKMSEVLNESLIPMSKARPEGTLSNFTADLVFEEITEDGIFKADFCLLNHGGLRAPLPKGNITLRNVYELMPFENQVVIVELTGEKVYDIAEYLNYTGGEPISHASVILGDSPFIKIQGEKVDPNKTYSVITSDYLFKGGDKMYFFKEPVSLIETHKKIRDLIAEHIREEYTLGNKLNATLDGRISKK